MVVHEVEDPLAQCLHLGAGLEVHLLRSSARGWSGRNASSAPAVAGEQLAVLLQQPGQLSGAMAGSSPSMMRGASPPASFGRDRQEEVVDEAGRLQLGVQARPALAEQRPDAALVAQVPQRRREVDPALVADDPQRGRGLRRLRLRGGEDQDAAAARR